MATAPGPLPQPNLRMVQQDGTPARAYVLYFPTLDAAVRALVAGNIGVATLTNAVNDAAAAAAGVAIGQLYRNGSVVQIRVA